MLIANVVVHQAKVDNKGCLVFKADFEKAYDSMRWDFLAYMLHRLGFCLKWIEWMWSWLQSSSILVLLNESSLEEFVTHKGLWQGDPLANFLLLVVTKCLNGLVREVEENMLFIGIHIGSGSLKVPLLQFGDDTIFFLQDDMRDALTLKTILRCFKLGSDLKVNFFNSSLASIHVDQGKANNFARVLNCKIWLFLYTWVY